MIAALGQFLLVIGLTQTLRTLILELGPRRGGLLLGLPTTTAMLLVCAGIEHGVGEAMTTAEVCLVGLVAAAAVPILYARVLSLRWGFLCASLTAAGGWFGVMAGLRCLPSAGPIGSIVLAGVGVLAACRLAGKLTPLLADDQPSAKGLRDDAPSRWLKVSRSIVPAFSFLAVRTLRTVVGPTWSGQFMTFPGASLAVLVSTHHEFGAATAHRVAAGMPVGGLGMLAFLAAFRVGCPTLGLGWGTFLGYVFALATLFSIDRLARMTRSRPGPDQADRGLLRRNPKRGGGAVRLDSVTPRSRHPVNSWSPHRIVRNARFSPRFEMLAG